MPQPSAPDPDLSSILDAVKNVEEMIKDFKNISTESKLLKDLNNGRGDIEKSISDLVFDNKPISDFFANSKRVKSTLSGIHSDMIGNPIEFLEKLKPLAAKIAKESSSVDIIGFKNSTKTSIIDLKVQLDKFYQITTDGKFNPTKPLDSTLEYIDFMPDEILSSFAYIIDKALPNGGLKLLPDTVSEMNLICSKLRDMNPKSKVDNTESRSPEHSSKERSAKTDNSNSDTLNNISNKVDKIEKRWEIIDNKSFWANILHPAIVAITATIASIIQILNMIASGFSKEIKFFSDVGGNCGASFVGEADASASEGGSVTMFDPVALIVGEILIGVEALYAAWNQFIGLQCYQLGGSPLF